MEENSEQGVSINPDTSAQDLEIENKALKDLLAENKTMIENLTKSLNEVKLTNAKLVNSLDISKQQESLEEIINKNFNRYANKR